MKRIKFTNDIEYNNIKNDNNKYWIKIKSIFNFYSISILFIINIILNIYLLIEKKKISKIIKEITFNYKNNTFKNNFPYNDKEMIGLYYPEINFDKIKKELQNHNIIASLSELINQMEIKLIYLEKEINLTKLISFYTSRKFFLMQKNITYDEKNLKELHEVINWIIIHKSNQLKGIASDKYLSCKYVEIKLGKNLCKQRIAIYNRFEEINYNKLSKYGNIVLKISNSCWKNIFISNKIKKKKFKEKMEKLKKLLEEDHGLTEAQFFHLYAKKRIIVEKQFIPLANLYEFRFFIVNNIIKFIYLSYYINMKINTLIYDTNFNFLFMEKKVVANPLNITSKFKKKILEELRNYAIKLSEDFPNFIRVDLYLFNDQIYFSELTFASYNGLPMFRNEIFVKDAVKNFSRIDDYY